MFITSYLPDTLLCRVSQLFSCLDSDYGSESLLLASCVFGLRMLLKMWSEMVSDWLYFSLETKYAILVWIYPLWVCFVGLFFVQINVAL